MKQQKGEENISFVCFLNLQDFLNMMKNNVYFLTFILLIKTDKYQLIVKASFVIINFLNMNVLKSILSRFQR